MGRERIVVSTAEIGLSLVARLPELRHISVV